MMLNTSVPVRKSWTVAIACLAVGFRAFAAPTGADLASGGYVIVHPEALATNDAFVIEDFNGLLARVLGERLKAVPCSQAPSGKRIFYGIAPDGAAKGVLRDQEHCITVENGDVYLFGGGINGARYAAYDLLKNVLGYKFIDSFGGMVLPDKAALKLKPMRRKRMFAFDYRTISWSCRRNGRESALFLFRHGFNGAGMTALMRREKLPEGCFVPDFRIAQPGDATLGRLFLPQDDMKTGFDWPKRRYGRHLAKEHPEYFGKKPDGSPDFSLQCCFSEPGARAEIRRRVFDFLAEAPEGAIVDVSAADHDGPFCRCPKCTALSDRYGTPGGPLLDFLLEMCPEVKSRFPGKSLMTLVYRKSQTQHPPLNLVKMPDNFVPDFAPIDDDFSKDWTHPRNKGTYEDLCAWGRLCDRMIVWYYPNPYGERVTPPMGNVGRVVNDIRLMKAAGTTGWIFEHNIGVEDMTGFSELQTYVMLRLWDDISLDADRLIDDYLEFEYGAAAKGVRAYLDELETLCRETDDFSIGWCPRVDKHVYLTAERMVRWDKAFDGLEKLLAGDERRLRNLHRVRFNLDVAMMKLYPKFRKAKVEAVGIDELGARIDRTFAEICKDAYLGPFAGACDRLRKYVRDTVDVGKIKCRADGSSLPKEIFGAFPEDKVFVKIPYAVSKAYVKDPEAAYGVAAIYAHPENPPRMEKPLVMYLYDDTAKRPVWDVGGEATSPNLEGARGKYRFYKCKPMKLFQDCFLDFGHDSGVDIRVSLSDVWEYGSFNRVQVWMSLRFEGPHFYPEDAGKANAIYCDRVVVVKE